MKLTLQVIVPNVTFILHGSELNVGFFRTLLQFMTHIKYNIAHSLPPKNIDSIKHGCRITHRFQGAVAAFLAVLPLPG